MTIQNTTGPRPGSSRRPGFTLVEILIVVTIIGLLVGLLVAVGNPALIRAREVAVQVEITEMSGAIDQFRNEFSFYPPSFILLNAPYPDGTPVDYPLFQSRFLPFLNKIAPNHQELTVVPGESFTRLQNWWNNVGINLDQRSSLVFWLSAVAQNRQFPLSDSATGLALTAFDDGTVERRKLYDFDSGRFRMLDGTGAVDVGGLPNVVGYDMPYGKKTGRLLYVYRESASYGFQDITTGVNTTYWAYHNGPLDASGFPISFINPNSFQLVAAGMDGDFGEPFEENPPGPGGDVFSTLRPPADDNICNFANGRMDKYINENQ